MCTVGTRAKIVETTYGKVDGNTVTLDDGTTVNSWYGIPFAKPPVDRLRFEVQRCAKPFSFINPSK